MAMARRLSRPTKASARRDLVGVLEVDQHGHVEIAVADMADDRRDQPLAAMSAAVSVTHSASREIGTQTSVATTLAPGRSPMQAQ